MLWLRSRTILEPRFGAAIPIERAFAALPHGAVHYRAAGSGPVVVALHESPRSSLSLLPVIEALASSHRVIAPDTPGYGLSDPLPGDAPTMDDFVDALVAFVDALGLGRIALYGAHTGAAIAAAFAARHPNRVVALALDGLSAFTPTEVETFRAEYLAPWQPRWDGGHVMGLWSRCKDLFTWFPWHDQSDAARLKGDPADLMALHKSALGFIQAGANYTKAYIRAAAFDPNAVLPGLAMPVTVMARPDDLIADHLDRLDAGDWRIRWLGPSTDDWRAALRDAVALGDADPAPSPPAATDGPCFFALGDGWLHIITHGPADGPVRLLLAGLPGDSAALIASEAAAHPMARLIAVDLPGCGRSDPLAAPSLHATAEALDALGLSPATIVAEGASLAVAQRWAAHRGWTGTIEAVATPSWLTGGAVPDTPLLDPLDPRWDGAHLIASWFRLRDMMLYDVPPGCGSPVRSAHPSTDVVRLDRLFRSLVEGPDCIMLLDEIRRYSV